jgi:hypothetical protein
MLQYALPLPDGYSRLDGRRRCRPNEPADGLTDRHLKQSTAVDQQSEVGRIFDAGRQLDRDHAGP